MVRCDVMRNMTVCFKISAKVQGLNWKWKGCRHFQIDTTCPYPTAITVSCKLSKVRTNLFYNIYLVHEQTKKF